MKLNYNQKNQMNKKSSGCLTNLYSCYFNPVIPRQDATVLFAVIAQRKSVSDKEVGSTPKAVGEMIRDSIKEKTMAIKTKGNVVKFKTQGGKKMKRTSKREKNKKKNQVVENYAKYKAEMERKRREQELRHIPQFTCDCCDHCQNGRCEVRQRPITDDEIRCFEHSLYEATEATRRVKQMVMDEAALTEVTVIYEEIEVKHAS